jgi:hypothetical protein
LAQDRKPGNIAYLKPTLCLPYEANY